MSPSFSKLNRTLQTSAAALLLGASSASFAAEPTVVLIGHAAPLTGQLAHMGKDSENAARLAIDEINSQHPVIDGKAVRLQLDAQDDAADPRTGCSAKASARLAASAARV